PQHAHHGGNEQCARLARARACFERTQASQHGKRRLGDESAVVLPERAVAAEIARQLLVRRLRELEQRRQRGACVRKQPAARRHGTEIAVTTWSTRPPSFVIKSIL